MPQTSKTQRWPAMAELVGTAIIQNGAAVASPICIGGDGAGGSMSQCNAMQQQLCVGSIEQMMRVLSYQQQWPVGAAVQYVDASNCSTTGFLSVSLAT
jgi:hypothetical protein